MATSKKPKKSAAASSRGLTGKKATLRDLSPKKNPKGGTTLPNLSSGARVGSIPAPQIPLNQIPGPGGLLVP